MNIAVTPGVSNIVLITCFHNPSATLKEIYQVGMIQALFYGIDADKIENMNLMIAAAYYKLRSHRFTIDMSPVIDLSSLKITS